MPRIAGDGTHRVKVEGLAVENVADETSFSISTRYLVEPPRTKLAFTFAAFIMRARWSTKARAMPPAPA